MADANISVDLINVSPELISFIVAESLAEKAGMALEKLPVELKLTLDSRKFLQLVWNARRPWSNGKSCGGL